MGDPAQSPLGPVTDLDPLQPSMAEPECMVGVSAMPVDSVARLTGC